MTETDSNASNRLTAIVVEDEPDVMDYITSVLKDEGFRVFAALDGAEAFRLIRRHRPDLVTLDISLPERSGVRLYRDIKEDVELSSIRVVMVTGVQTEFKGFIHSRRQVPSPEGYVSKPFSAEQLLEAVHQAMS